MFHCDTVQETLEGFSLNYKYSFFDILLFNTIFIFYELSYSEQSLSKCTANQVSASMNSMSECIQVNTD